MEALERLSAAELGRAILSGHVTPTEAVQYFAARIEQRNPSLNAFVYTRVEDALCSAK